MSDQWEIVVGPFASKGDAERWVEIVRRKSHGWQHAKIQRVAHVETTITERTDVDPSDLAKGETTTK